MLLLFSIPLAAASESLRCRIPLRDHWLIRQLDTATPDLAALTRDSASPDASWLRAAMPAEVHEVLLANQRIADPHVGRNAAACTWVAEKAWAYVCRFATPERVGGSAFLRFLGLDTLASAYLNGSPLGRFENQFREFSIEVTEQLAPPSKENVLVIIFSSPVRYLQEAKRAGDDPHSPFHKSLRKCHADFGSYLGAKPNFIKVGVFRDVLLDLPGPSWIEDVWIRTDLTPDDRSATVRAHVDIAGSGAIVQWTLIDPAGREIARGKTDGSATDADIKIPVQDAELWWPRLDGEANLYGLDIVLRSGEQTLDQRHTPFGIREIKPVLVDPATGERRFRFDVNGRPVFLRGGDWAPLEGLTHVWQPDRANRLLDLAEHANMNVIRVWGEGVIPDDSFYNECDRRGILIWQDFMFGWYDHRLDDREFVDNCRAEVEQMIRRLRNHPCLLLWVGGNEQYLWAPAGSVSDAKRAIFEELLPEACQRLDPTRVFHVSSPYGGSPTGNWPLEGDWHDYTTINHEPAASVPLFGSEVLRTSAPSITSMRRFLRDEQLWPEDFDPAVRTPGQPAWPPEWAYHSTGIATWDRIGAIQNYCDPTTAEDLVRVLGTAHGEYLRDRVERERRGVPDGLPDGNRRCWGNMVWRLNDTWPIIYSSVIDYYLEPKIAYYYLRRAYEPVQVSFEQTPDRICVWVVNDSPQAVTGPLVVQRLGFDGNCKGQLDAQVSLEPGKSKRCLDLTPLGEISLRSEFLRATLAGRESTHLLTAERYLHLPLAKLTVKESRAGIEISTDAFARQVALDFPGAGGAVFQDNFFDLGPGQTRTISLLHAADGRQLTVSAINADPIAVQLSKPTRDR